MKANLFSSVPTDRSQMFYWQVDRPFSEKEIKYIFLDRHQKFDRRLISEAIEYGMRETGRSKSQAKVLQVDDPIPRGSVNIVCRAQISDGTKLIIRMHPPGISNGYFWAESIASDLAKAAGVPTYKSFFIDDSKKRFKFDYMLTEQLPGVTLQDLWPIPPALDKTLIEETGKYLALVHSVNTNQFGFFDNQIAKIEKRLVGIHTKWKDHVLAAFENNLDYLIHNHVISANDRNKIETIFSRHQDLVHCDSPRLIQNDLADWNQLTDRGHVSGIIDWDECHSGDPIADFSAWSVFFPFERMEHLKRGYQQISALPDGFEEKLHLYRLRYIASKMVVRKKKLIFQQSEYVQNLLDFALKILQEEFKWYGV